MADPLPTPDFLVVGHVTRDLVRTAAGQEERPGGTASYAATVASRLGLRTAVLTSAPAGLALPPELADVAIVRLPAERATIIEHRWHGHVREQYVRSRAAPIRQDAIPEQLFACPVVLFGPLVGEVGADIIRCFQRSLCGATLQGWLRTTAADDHMEPVDPERWSSDAVLPGVRAAFLSGEDIGAGGALDRRLLALLDRWAASVSILAVTEGAAGARVAVEGRWHHIDGFPAHERDGTGAGDAFAAGFLIRYHETAAADEAARFAAAVASFVVEAPGIGGAPTREQVEARLAAHPEVVLEPLHGR